MTTDVSLADAVITSLNRDPRLPDAGLIAVDAGRGIVILRGTVESLSQLTAAEEDARELEGVYEVDNRLKVGPLGRDRREDYEIRGAALQSLIWDPDVPSDSIDVKVHNGWVTLTGDVAHQYQSNAAYWDVARLQGVVDVTNKVKVNPL